MRLHLLRCPSGPYAKGTKTGDVGGEEGGGGGGGGGKREGGVTR